MKGFGGIMKNKGFGGFAFMMDNFKEDIVSPRSNALGNVLYALCWVFIVLFGVYALMMLQVVMVQFSVLTLVAAVLHQGSAQGGI